MPNTDERRAKTRAWHVLQPIDGRENEAKLAEFEEKWAKFLKEKEHFGNPQDIADEFISKYFR